jgi:hypothetical protein
MACRSDAPPRAFHSGRRWQCVPRGGRTLRLGFDGRADKVHDGLLGGAVVPRGQRVLGADEGLAGECDDQRGKGIAEELHIELLRLLEGRHCQPLAVAGLGVFEHLPRAAECRVSLSPPGGFRFVRRLTICCGIASAFSAASPTYSVLGYSFVITSFTLRRLAACILLLISRPPWPSFI